MTKEQKLLQFFAQEGPYQAALEQLRNLILQTDLVETYKWQFPVYTLDGKNVVGLGAFKHHFGIWFFQGALLKDNASKLINAQQGKTVAMRQWRFTDAAEIDDALVIEYVQEAIENEQHGNRVKLKKSKNLMPEIPGELSKALRSDPTLQLAFATFTTAKQREFVEYIIEAKRASTRESRVAKIIPMIQKGEGLNDRYR